MSHTITIQDLKETITIDGKEYLLVNKPQIEKLLDDNVQLKALNAEHEEELKVLRNTVTSILNVLGLIDEKTGKMKAEIVSGEESYMKHILKALTKVITMLTLNQKKQLEEKFAFIGQAMPLINKYGKSE